MAITPARYNIRPQRRADFPLAVTFKDGDNNAMNLSGYSIVAQVWDKGRTSKIGDFDVTIDNASAGQVTLTLDYDVTVDLPDESYYDVMLIAPSGLREYYIEGIVRPSEGYSSP